MKFVFISSFSVAVGFQYRYERPKDIVEITKNTSQYDFKKHKGIVSSNITNDDTIILQWPWAETLTSSVRKLPKETKFPKFYFGYKLSDSCGGCFYTNNKEFEKDADSIFFETGDLFGHLSRSNESVPDHKDRNRSQYWIGWWKESATKGHGLLPSIRSNDPRFIGWDQSFNLTSDMRRDSDIWFAHLGNTHRLYYEQMIGIQKGVTNKSILKNKISAQLAAVMISNCDHTNHAKSRMKAVKELIKAGLTVTGVGLCFKNFKHPNVKYIPDRGDTSRLKSVNRYDVTKHHKFYLSFENGLHCRDYISEKLWRNGYGNLAVPIVYGPWRDDVIKRTPPNSFIFLEDYKSPGELVSYLKYLDRNDTAYMEYFEWRNDIQSALEKTNPDLDYVTKYDDSKNQICRICLYLQEKKRQGWPEKKIKSYSVYISMVTTEIFIRMIEKNIFSRIFPLLQLKFRFMISRLLISHLKVHSVFS